MVTVRYSFLPARLKTEVKETELSDFFFFPRYVGEMELKAVKRKEAKAHLGEHVRLVDLRLSGHVGFFAGVGSGQVCFKRKAVVQSKVQEAL